MKKHQILLVDDDKSSHEIMSFYLSTYELIYANNPSEALRILEHKEFDLIVTDINMPEMSGIDFIREMKKRNYRIPVIVVSASKTHESILALKSDSVRQVFEKPLQAEPFIIAVQEALKQKK